LKLAGRTLFGKRLVAIPSAFANDAVIERIVGAMLGFGMAP